MLRERIGFSCVLGFLVGLVFSSSSFATQPPAHWYQFEKSVRWRPVFTLTAGGAFSNDMGSSKYIPISSQIEDQFFNYQAHHNHQASFLYGAFLGAEIYLNPRWLLQTGLAYYEPGAFRAGGAVTQGADSQSANTYTYSYDINAHQLLAEAKLLYNCQQYKRFHPYVVAGMGAGFNAAHNYQVNIQPAFTTFSNQFPNQDTTSFSYSIGLGIDMDMTNKLRLGLGYRFADLGKVTLGNASIDQVPTNNNLSQSHLYTNEVVGQLTFVM